MAIGPGDALLVVDVQNDFLPGGSLAVAGGDAVVPELNRWIAAFRERGLPIFATRDWHPADHGSFRAQGGPWPPHCVQRTPGAALAAGLVLPPSAEIVSKGMDRDRDGYSGFDRTDLAARLRRAGARRLFVGGLTSEHCVRHTVRDALAEGFEVRLLVDAVRAVEEAPGDGASAEREMLDRGAIPARWPP